MLNADAYEHAPKVTVSDVGSRCLYHRVFDFRDRDWGLSQMKVTILKDITPKGWTSVFYAATSRIDYDAKSPIAKKDHQLSFQRGPHYGNVGDMCAGLSHDQLLDLERRGFVRIERVTGG